MSYWYDRYQKLDLQNGKIEFILEDDQDMIEIRYSDGMLIDVGYIEDVSKYYIAVVLSDDERGWESPIDVVEVIAKDDLLKKLQETIFQYRRTDS